MPITCPQVGCYDGGNSEQTGSTDMLAGSAYLFVISKTKISKHSKKHWKQLKVNKVKHCDEHGVEKKTVQRVKAKLAEQG